MITNRLRIAKGSIVTVCTVFLVGSCGIAQGMPSSDGKPSAGTLIAAFPGAEGFGMYAIGGREGAVHEVTNLDDSGPGSLRAACEAEGPRTVVFRVSGTIQLKSRLNIMNPYITIAGQTAPGDGICLRDDALMVRTHDVIIRHMRSRVGGSMAKSAGDSIDVMRGSRDVIIDHCSLSWGTDECASFYGNRNVTVQWCMIGEGFYPHSCGGLWGSDSSYHHNLIYSNGTRNPRFAFNEPNTVSDFRNNVVYNWGYQSGYGGENGQVNMVNNYYRPGPGTREEVTGRIVRPAVTGRWYIEGNFVEGSPKISANNWDGGVQTAEKIELNTIRVRKPFAAPSVRTQSAKDAYDTVLQAAGCTVPRRDAVDERVLQQVRTKTYTFTGRKEDMSYPGIPESVEMAGGWPELRTYDVPADSDHDGMPDAWEKTKGLNPDDPQDRNGHKLDTHYTNLEIYLNSLCPDPYNGAVKQ